MRDRETIDSELRRIALRREVIRAQGGQLSSREVDELLDERLGHRVRAPEPAPVATSPGATRVITRRRRRRIGPGLILRSLVLPVSVIAAVAVLVALIAHRTRHAPPPAAESSPPSAEATSGPALQPSAQPARQVNVVDTAFVEALTRNGVPVPSQDYAVTHGHAVCDFLARQPDGSPTFTNAVRFVQSSTIWDANQSADVTAGAVISYCPRYQLTGPPVQQPDMQKTLTDMQKIQGELQGIDRGLTGIEGDLKGIQGGLPNLPGQP